MLNKGKNVLPLTNALAYFPGATITKQKSFSGLATV
jgi:hypothetical protein